MAFFNKEYIFNWAEETAWAVGIAVIAVVGPMLLALENEDIGVWGASDWKTWGLAALVAGGRVGVAVLLNAVRKLIGSK